MQNERDKLYVKRNLKRFINLWYKEKKILKEWIDSLEGEEKEQQPPIMTIKDADAIAAIRQLSQIDGLNTPKEIAKAAKLVPKWKN